MGRVEDARTASLRDTRNDEFSVVQLLSAATYGDFLPTISPDEEQVSIWTARLMPPLAGVRAARLDLDRRFAESARLWDALAEMDAEHTPETNSSMTIARAAIAHALAGNFALAAQRAKAAHDNSEKRRLEGKPESGPAELVELLDFYGIIEQAHSGDIKAARRLFSARSQWLSASLGSVMELSRRLRQDASPDELIGGLAKSPEELWKDHADSKRAEMLAKDSDNKSLFALVPAERSGKLYQAVAKNVWRTDNSKIVLKNPKADPSKSRFEIMYLPLTDPVVALDAYVLHAALIARSRGQQGFVFTPSFSSRSLVGLFRTGNRGDRGFPAEMFINANDVIQKLSPLIPMPAS
jgi:hypothetical protein